MKTTEFYKPSEITADNKIDGVAFINVINDRIIEVTSPKHDIFLNSCCRHFCAVWNRKHRHWTFDASRLPEVKGYATACYSEVKVKHTKREIKADKKTETRKNILLGAVLRKHLEYIQGSHCVYDTEFRNTIESLIREMRPADKVLFDYEFTE